MTGRKRTGLPPVVLWLGYLALTAGSAFLADSLSGRGMGALRHVASAAGATAMAMILMQMVTSGRFERLSGRLGIDVTMGFHKWAAPVALGFAVLHVVALPGLPDPARPGRFASRLEMLLTGPGLWDGRLSLVVLALLVTLALVRDRLPWRYELWRAGHLVLAVGLVAVLLAHVLTDAHGAREAAGLWWIVLAVAAIAPALWVYVRRLVLRAGEGWVVAGVRRVADRLWEVRLSGRPGQGLRFQAGQFAWVAFGRHRLPLFDHPFSIASPPGEEATPRFVIREAGDFTGGIGAVAPGTRVGVDAPHGSFGLEPGDAGPVLLMAGGVGIAPILSILGDLARLGPRPVRLIYVARDASAMVDPALWRPALDRLGGEALLLATRGAGPGMETGRPTVTHLERMLAGWDRAQVTALICGPGEMMTWASDTLEDLGLRPARIRYERFDYSAGRLSRRDRRLLWAFIALWLACLAVTLAAGLT